MGRPKKAAPKPGAAKPKTIGYRVSGEYAAWLERVATKHRTTLAGLMDRALAEWAASQGDEPAPIRMP